MPGAANPRGIDQWTGRIMEFTGGFRPREMAGDYDVNPNEDSDGLSHHNRHGTATEDFREQIDPKERRKKALRELEGDLPHVSIKPEEMGEMLDNTPLTENESTLYESAMGVDMGHASRGIGISQGANVGPVRREGPGLIFGRSNDAFEDAWSLMKQPKGNVHFGGEDVPDDWRRRGEEEAKTHRAKLVQEDYDEAPDAHGQSFVGATAKRFMRLGDGKIAVESDSGDMNISMDDIDDWRQENATQENPNPPAEWFQSKVSAQENQRQVDEGFFTPYIPTPKHSIQNPSWNVPDEDLDEEGWDDMPDLSHNALSPHIGAFGTSRPRSNVWQTKNASFDPPFLSDIVKAKRKKRGRKYEEDEESEEDERKAKKKRKREKKRKMKRGKREASRQPHSKTARRAASAEQNISRETKRQAFAPRRMFSGNPRAKDLPLRLKDPIAYQRKLAAEKFRRTMGSLPAGHSAHADTRGIHGKVQTIGMSGKGTKLPSQSSSSRGTSFKKPKTAEREGSLLHDPLGSDPLKMLLEKRATFELRAGDIKGLNRSELLELKRDLKKVIRALGKLSKSTPELGQEAKVGATGDEEKNTAPTGPTSIPEDEKPWRMVCDTSVMPAAAAAGAGKR